MAIRFRAVRPTAQLPVRASEGDFGYDLYVAESVEIWRKGLTVLVPTGLALADPLPENVAMMILPRSSTLKRHGLIVGNSPGLVDRLYTGEIQVVVHAIADTDMLLPVRLAEGDRIAQLVFVPVLTPTLQLTDDMTLSGERGGFGSTGV